MGNIAVNGRFEGRRISGVDRYASEVSAHLGQRVRIVAPPLALGGFAGHMWEQMVLPLLVHSNEVLWSPTNSGPVILSRQVVTIHDLSVLEHPEWFSPAYRSWYRKLLPCLARRARQVLTVSEHSRGAIIRVLGLGGDKVTCIPNGVNLSMFKPCSSESIRRKYRLTKRYVLFVGAIDPRKNLSRLMRAWEALSEFPELELVIAGCRTPVFGPVYFDHCIRGVRWLGYVPDADLPALYAGAEFFIMPSLSEGFGLTVLEAMACGTPVISSSAGALSDVTGEAAVHVDPQSVDQITQAMRTLLTDETLRSKLRDEGLERARRYSWERSAEQVWEVLSRCA